MPSKTYASQNALSTDSASRIRVSVVVPIFNHETYVSEAINSILLQDFTGLEIVLVDDGSSDKSLDTAIAALKNTTIPYQIHQQSNQGAHAAINKGISLSHGEWITILNSDDKFFPSRISRLMDYADQENSQFVFSRVRYVDENGRPLLDAAPQLYYYHWSIDNRELYPTPNFEMLRHNYAITTGNFFFHRSIFERIGTFQDFKICHDWDFILRALLVTEISFLDEALYEYRVHPNNTIRPEVQELRYQEMDSLLSNYLRQAETASNPLAPCFKNWGNYWVRFLSSQIPFGYLPKTAEVIEYILTHPASAENIIPDQARQDLLAVALQKTQTKALDLEEELVNVRKYFESRINKSIPTLIAERLKGRLVDLYSKMSGTPHKK